MLFIFIAVVIVILIVNSQKGTGVDTGKNPPANTKSIDVSFGSEIPRTYSSVLNGLEKDVYYIANYSSGYGEISVVVVVQKINSTYCSVSGNFLADVSFRGVNFGTGYNFDGNDHVSFQTKLATGFTNPEAVKREMLIQFHWSDLSAYNTSFTVLDHGDFAQKPYISYSFTVKKGF